MDLLETKRTPNETMAAKYQKIADLLKTRIKHGDYAVNTIPPERRLATETKVSYMTARRAVQQLVDEGLLVRRANGRVAVNPDRSETRLQLAFLSPSYGSGHADQVRLSIEKIAAKTDAVLRPVTYVHWDDPIVQDTITGFDGVFFNPLPEEMPKRLVSWMATEQRPVVVLDQDLSASGLPSLLPFPREAVHHLLDHLSALGHTRIDCLNTQPMDHVVRDRIDQWQVWLRVHGATGRLINEPVDIYQSPRNKARQVVTDLIDSTGFDASALLCVTIGAAIGTVRAFADHGRADPLPVSVCTIDGEGIGEYYNPSITSLKTPDLAPQLAICVEWMARGGKGWIGPLAIKSHNVPLFIGESTRPVAG